MSTGTPGNDTLYGTPTNDILHGLDGDDILYGLAGDDILYGQNGKDTLEGGDGADTLRGGNEPDKLFGNAGNDILNGQNGEDILTGGDGADTLRGGNDSDKLFGNVGDDILNGENGKDTMEGGDGADTLRGGNDSDKLFGNVGDDILNGENGKDTMEGGDGADTLRGGNDPDELFGNAGNDILNGQDGDDNLEGGDDNDVLRGGNDNDELFGNAGNDILNGQDGDDNLEGGDGNDRLRGGDGSNTLTGANTNANQPGYNEKDTLSGGNDDDLFILGDVDEVYYDSLLNDDYALILNFDSAQEDLIQLHGNADDYRKDENIPGLPPGTAIILKTDGEDELIGIVRNVFNMDLNNTDEFSYANNGNIQVDFKVDKKWDTGFTGSITLTNQGQETIKGWTLAFDSSFIITVLWNAKKDSENNGNYQISNESWNGEILPNKSISFGFNGSWSGETVPPPTNYKFNGEFIDPFPGLSVNDVSLVEEQEGSNDVLFTVTLSAASDETVTVDYATEDDTAIAGVDYTATNGTLTFAPGETSKTIAVAINGDSLYEGPERFLLNLTNASNANLVDNQGIATIIDDDVAPPGLSINNISVIEGNEGLTYANLAVNVDSSSDQTITVEYSTQDVSATAGQDYVAKSETLSITPGETTQTLNFAINGDTVSESNETFKVNLSNANNAEIIDGQGIVKILDDDDDPGEDQDYVLGAYYPEWAIYDRDFQVEDIPAENLTHIFYAFAKIDDNGKVAPFDVWAATQETFKGKYTWDESQAGKAGNLAELQALKEEYPHLTNMISIGGWTLSGPFSDVALTETSRKVFAKSAVDFMVEYGFDGIDIDWEYPVSGGLPDNVYRPEDTENYTLLLGELRKQLDEKEIVDDQEYQLTVASPGGIDNLVNYDLAGMSKHLDFFNVMAYDYHGAWESTTNHQAALYGNQGDVYNVDYTVKKYLDAGVAAEDVVMGAPLYGRSWQGVGNTNSGLFQPGTGAGPGTWENGLFDYYDLYDKVNDPNGGYFRHWDGDAKVPYVYNESLGVFSTYEDIQSLTQKLNYIDQKSLGGMFFWEASADLSSSHTDYLTDSLIGLAASELGVV